MDMGFFLQKERIFPGVHKIGAPISGPRIADTNFTDTGIFLKMAVVTRFHKSCHFMLVVVWRSLGVQLLPLDDGQVEKSSFHGCYRFGTSGG